MFAYKRTAFFATTILAAAIAVAFAYAPADMNVNFPKAAKLDVSASQLRNARRLRGRMDASGTRPQAQRPSTF